MRIPAGWRGNLAHLLPKHRRVRGHFAAMPYAEVAGFVQALREYQPKSAAAYALDLVILTGVRTNEALGAKWAEIDIANALWTIPKRPDEDWRGASRSTVTVRDANCEGHGGD